MVNGRSLWPESGTAGTKTKRDPTTRVSGPGTPVPGGVPGCGARGPGPGTDPTRVSGPGTPVRSARDPGPGTRARERTPSGTRPGAVPDTGCGTGPGPGNGPVTPVLGTGDPGPEIRDAGRGDPGPGTDPSRVGPGTRSGDPGMRDAGTRARERTRDPGLGPGARSQSGIRNRTRAREAGPVTPILGPGTRYEKTMVTVCGCSSFSYVLLPRLQMRLYPTASRSHKGERTPEQYDKIVKPRRFGLVEGSIHMVA
jgi:hypothetical protein